MKRILFVANGHGETAIAARIAAEVPAVLSERCELELFPLVGRGSGAAPLAVVGPRRDLPSGGLVAMGNVRALLSDVRAGFAFLLARQIAFLRAARDRYDVVVAVGDVYALALALLAGVPAIFVGTAKSVYVAPYGPVERAVIRRAVRAFVRDAATAQALAARRTPAQAPGNVIVDLASAPPATGLERGLGIFPGSRADAYADGVRLGRVVRALAARRSPVLAYVSIAPTLAAEGFAHAFATDGWNVAFGADTERPFEAAAGGARLVAWAGPTGALLGASILVLGQAGTANEQAAAFGVPVVALGGEDGREPWYRMRQRKLLGDALAIVPGDPEGAAAAIDRLLNDPATLERMAAAGRERMGPSGGAAAIALAIARVAAPAADGRA